MGRFTFLRRWLRRSARVLGVLALLALVGIALLLTLDLGPAVRGLAEREGSRYLERPLHIGAIKIRLAWGDFVVENLRIDGPTPADRPFFTAKRIVVAFPWWTLVRGGRTVVESVELTDWEMLVELLPGGRTNLPKLTSGRPSRPGGRPTVVQVVRATRGTFTYVDRNTWNTTSPNLDVLVTNVAGAYRGRASFSDGRVQIKSALPMRSDMRCSFRIGTGPVEGGKVFLDEIDLETDGARSAVTGTVDFRHWPEMTYHVRSKVDFKRMREIFFARDRFTARGAGEFTGTFRLFKGGHELKGDFSSDLAHVNAFAFPNLRGSLVWQPHRFDVFNASAGFYGGRARFTYAITSISMPEPTMSRFEVAYDRVDLAALTDFLETRGLRLAGRASGTNVLEYPLGKFAEHRGEGRMRVEPPDGVVLYSRSAPAVLEERTDEEEAARGNPGPLPPLARQPIGGDVAYRFDPEWIEFGPGWAATRETFVEFHGRTAYGDRSEIPFYARSADWQESDRLLAAIITSVSGPAGTVAMGGHGEFSGRMLHSFRRPRIEGTFAGSQTRAWGVIWGDATGGVVVEDGFVEVTDAVVTRQGSSIHVNGRFSLSYPRRDAAEEINARFRVVGRPLGDLRHAFGLDAYPLEGKVGGEYHLYGRYNRPFGFGRATIDEAVAYGEPIDRVSASLRFEGVGVRFDGVQMEKAGGRLTGAAYVAWDGRYSFNADARRIPLESVESLRFARAPLSGFVGFNGGGTGFFSDPAYGGKVRIDDLSIGDEGLGQLTGQANVHDGVLELVADLSSPLLAVAATGQLALSRGGDADLSLRLTHASLDSFVRIFEPRLSPYTSAEASGRLRVVGPLTDPANLLVEGTVETLRMRLFDYELRNGGNIRIAFDRNRIRLGAGAADGPARLAVLEGVEADGRAPRLELGGTIDLDTRQIDARANGEANLGVLQGFFPGTIRSRGQVRLAGDIRGTIEKPVFSGTASIADGRVRHASLPHSIDAINGVISFGTTGIRINDVTAQLGSGRVQFGGLIGLNGYVPDALNLTATGQNMRLRYPEGFRSVVDADLALVGTFKEPLLKGTVDVRSAVYDKRLNVGGLLELVGVGTSGDDAAPPSVAAADPGGPPLRFDIRIVAPSTLQVNNNLAQIVSSADLSFRGTYDRPLLLGRAEVERGKLFFEGKQYVVTHGTIDFNNPSRIEPYFDVQAETRVRAQSQLYLIDLRFVGTFSRIQPQMTSDPPLPAVDVLSLLMSDVPQVQDAELRALRQPGAAERQLLQSRVTQALATSLSSGVEGFVEHAIGLDTFQIKPQIGDPYQRLPPGARLTIGKRISDRIYLTLSRSLTSPTDQIIWLVEYDETDRLSWVVSKNEDRTYAIDLRVRHAF